MGALQGKEINIIWWSLTNLRLNTFAPFFQTQLILPYIFHFILWPYTILIAFNENLELWTGLYLYCGKLCYGSITITITFCLETICFRINELFFQWKQTYFIFRKICLNFHFHQLSARGPLVNGRRYKYQVISKGENVCQSCGF